MHFRAYDPRDRAACLEIFDGNAARYFSPGDREAFAAFLEAPVAFYGVLCDDQGMVVSCGGLAPSRSDPAAAVLMWGMVRADLHGRGLGRELLQRRLERLADFPDVRKVTLHTSHETAGFCAKMGFRETARIPDGYRPGLHRCEMSYEF